MLSNQEACKNLNPANIPSSFDNKESDLLLQDTTQVAKAKTTSKKKKHANKSENAPTEIADKPPAFYDSRYADSSLFNALGKKPLDFIDSILSITVQNVNSLHRDIPLFHPVVKLHIIDQISGSYIQKSNPNRKVVSTTENSTVSTILPIMTQSYVLEGKMHLCPNWNEEIVFNEEYLHLLQDNVIVFFELLDFGSHWKMADKDSDGWYRVCWGFLKLVGSTKQANTEHTVELQLYEYPVNLKKKSLMLNLFDGPPSHRHPRFFSKTSILGHSFGTETSPFVMPINANSNIVPDSPGVAIPMTPNGAVALGLRQSAFYSQMLAGGNTAGQMTTNRIHQTPYVWQLWRWMFSSNADKKMQYLKYPGKLRVTVKAHKSLLPKTVSSRSMLPNEIEKGRYSLSQLKRRSDKSASSSQTDISSSKSNVSKFRESSLFPSPDTQWRRKTSQEKIRLPNATLYNIQASQLGSLSVAFSPSGNLLAIAAMEKSPKSWPIRVYSTVTGERLAELLGHQDVVYDLEWNKYSVPSEDKYPDEELMSTSSDGTVRVWNFSNPEHVHLSAVFQHPKYVYTGKWVPPADKRSLIITGSYDCRIRIWINSSDAEPLSPNPSIHSGKGSLHQRRRSSSAPDPLWTKATTHTKPCKVLTGHDSYVNAICFENEALIPSSRFLSGDGNGCIRIWSNRATPAAVLEEANLNYECIKVIQTSNQIPVLHLEMHPRDRLVLVTFASNQVMTLDHKIYRFVNEYKGVESNREGVVMRAIWSTCGTYAIASDPKGRVWVWYADSGKKAAVYDNLPFDTLVHSISCHPKDHMLAFCGYGENMPLIVSTWDPSIQDIEELQDQEELLPIDTLSRSPKDVQPSDPDNPFSPQMPFSPLDSLKSPSKSRSSVNLSRSVDLQAAQPAEPPAKPRRKHRKSKKSAPNSGEHTHQQDSSSYHSSETLTRETVVDDSQNPFVGGEQLVTTIKTTTITKRHSIKE